MIKRFWLIWDRTLDHRVCKTDNDEPDIPILPLRDAKISLLIRSFIITINIVTCFFIMANIIKNW